MSHHSSGRRHRHHAKEDALLRWVVFGGSSLIGFGLLLALFGVASTQRAQPVTLGGTGLVLVLAVLAVLFLAGLFLNTGRLAATVFNTLKLYAAQTALKQSLERSAQLRHRRESTGRECL